MTISLVASVSRGGTGTTGGIDTTGADLLVAMTAGQSAAATITDSKGNTWTALTNRTGGASCNAKLWYCANPSVGSGHTFSISGTFPSVCVLAFSGCDTSSPFDQQNGGNSLSSGSGPGSITPTENNEVLVTMASGGDNLSSVGSGFTLQQNIALGGTNFASAIAYLVQTTATAANPAWTYASNTYGDAQAIASFKSAGGGSDFPLAVDVGAFTLTGQAVGLLAARKLTSSVGAYTHTGQSAGLVLSRKIVSDVGSYVLTGADTGLQYSGADKTISVGVGTFTYTGVSALLTKGFLVANAVGTFTLTGNSSNLLKGFYLGTDLGSYTLTGIDAGLTATRTLTIDNGSFTLTGQSTNLLKGFYLGIGVGTYTLTGVDVGLQYSGAISPLTASTGSFALTGQNIGVLYNRILGLDLGTFTLTGNSANLLCNRLVQSDLGTFTLAGNPTNPLHGYVVTSSPGSYTLTGISNSFKIDRAIQLSVGTYTLTGVATSLLVSAQQHHYLYGTLRWSPNRYQTVLVGNDNTVWLTGVRDATDPINSDGTPKTIEDCTVTWEIRDQQYPNGVLLGYGTATSTGQGGEYTIEIDDAITGTLESNEAYWLNVMFVDNNGYTGLISSRFLARVRTGLTVGT